MTPMGPPLGEIDPKGRNGSTTLLPPALKIKAIRTTVETLVLSCRHHSVKTAREHGFDGKRIRIAG